MGLRIRVRGEDEDVCPSVVGEGVNPRPHAFIIATRLDPKGKGGEFLAHDANSCLHERHEVRARQKRGPYKIGGVEAIVYGT